jgi:phosphatidylserine decarboxylase
MRIAREGWPFVAALGAVTIVCAWAAGPWLAVPCVGALLFVTWFFRDPERECPAGSEALLSPADGRVIRAAEASVSIFMNVFDVHVCRTPMAGRVEEVRYVPGRFLAAYRDAASQSNERASIRVRGDSCELIFTLVAGLIARRIVCRVSPGQQLGAGERVGLIRFGSRVDVTLPAGYSPVVEVGRRVVAGETVIARRAPSP